MRDVTKRKIDAASLEKRPWPKKPTELRSFSSSTAATKLPLGSGSSSHLWKKPLYESHGHASASSNLTKLYLQMANSNTSPPAAADDNEKNIENPNPNTDKKNAINGGGNASSSAGADHSSVKTNEGKPADMDPKRLKRIMSNRASAQKSRMKKNQHVAELERQAKSLETKIALLQPQISAHKNQQRLLLIEQQKLKIQMAAREKERILQEVEIEKNRAEIRNRLSELQRKHHEAHTRMLNLGSSRSNYSRFGQMVSTSLDQESQIGEERSRLIGANLTKQPQKQDQTWISKWKIGQSPIANLGFVKSEPET